MKTYILVLIHATVNQLNVQFFVHVICFSIFILLLLLLYLIKYRYRLVKKHLVQILKNI